MNSSKHIQVKRVEFGRVSVLFGENGGKYPDGNQVLIKGGAVNAAFDTPMIANYIGEEFDSTELVVLGHVHEDHMAGLHRLPDAEVFVHEADLMAARSRGGLMAHFGISDERQQLETLESLLENFHYAPRPDAQGYQDGQTWNLGRSTVRAFHMPGHTAGHTVLLVEPEGVLFIGDIDLTGFGPYYGDACSSLRDFRQSLRRLAEIPAKVWVTSHHRGIYTDRSHFLADLKAFAAKIDQREERLLALLGPAPLTLEQLVNMRLLYPKGYSASYVVSAETRTIQQHLAELVADGRVRVGDAGLFQIA